MKISTQHRSFLNHRGITDSIIDAFSISSGDVPFLHLNNAIIIPVRHIDGELSFNKYRRDPIEVDVKPKYLYDRGGKVTLYGADKLVAQYPFVESETLARSGGFTLETNEIKHNVIITEGELDTLVCWSKGIPAVSSTGGAQSFQEEWVQLLKGYEVYICFDNDEAGHKGAIKVLDYLPEAKVMFVPSNIPGVKDISDYCAHGGDLHKLMSTARQYLSVEDVEVDMQRIAALWGDYSFHTLYIEHHRKSLPTDTSGLPNRDTSLLDPTDRVGRAKAVDCLTIAGIEWHKEGAYYKSKCLWHADNDPSLTYYPQKNNCYCFVCGKYADVIDLVMAKESCDFKGAVSKLLRE